MSAGPRRHPLRPGPRFLAGAIVLAWPALAADLPPLSPQETLAEPLVTGQYARLRELLEKDAEALVGALKPGNAPDLANPEIRLRLLLLATLDRLPAGRLGSGTAERTAFLRWLFGSPDRLEILLAEIRPEDRPLAVIDTWAELWKLERNPGFRDRYAPLALALALIYDDPDCQPKSSDQGYRPTHGLIDRYEWYRDRSESGRLTVSCKGRSVRELVHTVDHNITPEELDWVDGHVSGSRSKCGNQYDEIEYLMERAVNGLNPYEAYTLPEIKKHGGICGDQAHYAANAAKARGIPAMVVTGTGDRGPHAWIAFMPDPHEWASHASHGITNGYVFCSQRGAPVPERQLRMESERDYDLDRRVPALLGLQLARTATRIGKYDIARRLLDAAREHAGLNVELWQGEEALLLARHADAGAWKDLVTRLEREFRDYPDVLEWALDLKIRHVIGSLPEEEVVKIIERELRRVSRKLGTQGSALVNTIGHIGELIATSGSENAGKNLQAFYRTCFRRYGEDLEVFSLMAGSYAHNGEGLPDLRPEIPDDLLRYYKRQVETGSKEFFRAQMELYILRQIAGIHARLAPDRADELEKLERDIARRRERIARAAD